MKAREIAELVGGELRGDGDLEIVSVSDFLTAAPEQIVFIEKPDRELTTDASCLIVPPGFDPLIFPNKNLAVLRLHRKLAKLPIFWKCAAHHRAGVYIR